jgi:hypothetical protein
MRNGDTPSRFAIKARDWLAGDRKGDVLNFPYTKSPPATVPAWDSRQRKKAAAKNLQRLKKPECSVYLAGL